MSANKPLQATHEVATKIIERVDATLETVLRVVAVAFPDLHPDELGREVAMAAYRWSHRLLDAVGASTAPPRRRAARVAPSPVVVELDVEHLLDESKANGTNGEGHS